MTKETWTIIFGDNIAVATGDDAGHLVVSPPPAYWPSYKKHDQRKHIIAAAPDLLEACELVLEWQRSLKSSWSREVLPALEAAVAKARPATGRDVLTAHVAAEALKTASNPIAPPLKTWYVFGNGFDQKVEAERLSVQNEVLSFYKGDERVASFHDFTHWVSA